MTDGATRVGQKLLALGGQLKPGEIVLIFSALQTLSAGVNTAIEASAAELQQKGGSPSLVVLFQKLAAAYLAR